MAEVARREKSRAESPVSSSQFEGSQAKMGIAYEVFSSFRGRDIHTGFTDHLCSSLVDAGFSVFQDDDKLRQIVSSRARPDDRVQEQNGTLSCPSSTKSSPGMWGTRRGVSGRPFIQLRSIMTQRWSNDGSELSKRHEAKLVKIIVRKVLGDLKEAFELDVTENLVGTSAHVEEIMRILSTDNRDTRIVEIHGMVVCVFRRDFPLPEFGDLSRDIVFTTGGLPLALEVIGSFLCGKRLVVWKDTLKKLRQIPDKEMQETFRRMGIEALSVMPLIKVGNDHRFLMHDQLRDFGREFVQQENYMEPWKHSRLRIHKEALRVLEENKGTKKIEVLCLNKSGLGRVYSNLAELPESLGCLQKLQCLSLKECNSLRGIPNSIGKLECLTELDISCTGFTELPKSIGDLRNFEVLQMVRSYVTRLPRGIGMLEKLTILDATNCEILAEVCSDIGELSSLKALRLLGTDLWLARKHL
ncbi:disease resistance protein RPV1-like [Eucalyptus grandis]|uniref:disease resistance protein RPV1-like n=1 Tax=Eucalyptus grandis TaxID=71139 RepID=UPI00192EFCB2|nr:disease resistance protein RPV1-like [Eucalyptus grandis]